MNKKGELNLTKTNEKRNWMYPLKVSTLAMRVLATLGAFTTTMAFMTNHAKEQAELNDRKCPKSTKKSGDLGRPLVIDFAGGEWFITDGSPKNEPAVWLNDKMHGFLLLCYQESSKGDNWVVKTIPSQSMWVQSEKKSITKAEFVELPQVLLQINTLKDKTPLEPKPQEIMKPTASFEFQKQCLSAMNNDNLKRFRKHLGISGNPSGKPGRASTEALRQQVYDYLEGRNRWIEVSAFR